MKQLLYFILASVLLVSCNDFDEQTKEAEKLAQKNELVFQNISKKWKFNFPQDQPEIEKVLLSWNEWQQFQKEMQQKPKTSILAFQMKVKNVSGKADTLAITVPERYNSPQVRSRLITLNTKIKSLDTFIHLQDIPEKKVMQLIEEINTEIIGIYKQWNEIIIKATLPKEIGEDEMIRALDTTRNANSKLMQEKMEQENQESTPKTNLYPKK
jgi:hypothetical protein